MDLMFSASPLPQTKTMKYIKQLSEFSLIFLHPLECPKCIAAEQNSFCNEKQEIPILALLNKNYQAYETLLLKKVPPSKYVLRKLIKESSPVQKYDLNNVPLSPRNKVFRKTIRKEPTPAETPRLRFLQARKQEKKIDILRKLKAKFCAKNPKVFNGFSKPLRKKVGALKEKAKETVSSAHPKTCDLSVEQPEKEIRKISIIKEPIPSKIPRLRFLPARQREKKFDILRKLEAKFYTDKPEIFNGFSKPLPKKVGTLETKVKETVPSTPPKNCDLPVKQPKKEIRKISIRKESIPPKTHRLRFLPARKREKKFDILRKLETKFCSNKPKVFNGFSKPLPKKVRVLKKKVKQGPRTSPKICDLPVEQPKKEISKISTKKKSPKADKVKTVKQIKKSPSVKKNSPSSSTESSAEKVPGKGTLKRKRWLREQLNNSNENHEDDLFENQKFEQITELFENDTDKSDDIDLLTTPVFPFSLSPCERSPSPTYKDCYSPTDITELRNRAEEYRFRKGKKWKKELFPKNKIDATKTTEKSNKNTFKQEDVEKTLEAVARILDETQNKLNESESEDDYYTDIL